MFTSCLARLTNGSVGLFPECFGVLNEVILRPVPPPLRIRKGCIAPSGTNAHVIIVRLHLELTRKVNDRRDRMQPSLDRNVSVIRCWGVEPSVWQGEDVREEPENPRKREVKAGFRENTPGKDEEDSYDRFDDGKEPPSCDVGNSRVGRAGLGSFEELGGYTVLRENPATEDFPQNDGDEGNGIFEARAIVYGLGVLIHHEQADCGRSNRDCVASGYQLQKKTKEARLTHPTAIGNGLSNPFQVKMLESPDDGAYDDPKGAVREGVHGSIYTSKNDAKGIEDNGGKIAVVAG